MRMIFKPVISVVLTPYSDEMLLDLTRYIYRGVTQVCWSWAGTGAAAAASDELGELRRCQDSQDEPHYPHMLKGGCPTTGSLTSSGGLL